MDQKQASEKMKELKQEYREVQGPKQGLEQVIKKMEEAEEMKMKTRKMRNVKLAGMAAAAAVAVVVALPNTNRSIAHAMQSMPVIGKVFEVVTFRNYEYADEKHEAKVKVPEIVDKDGKSSAAKEVNRSVEDYMKQAIAQFEKEIGENQEGHQGLDISYDTVTDNEDWFVLKVTALETQASGAETVKYYTIHKKSDKVVNLSDLFKDGADYVNLISEAIKNSMKEQMKQDENIVYFIDSEEAPESDFVKIREDQTFYINEDGNLVIVFNEYEVAPGYMGSPEFVITDAAAKGAMR